jgi:general secretion pathway protein D
MRAAGHFYKVLNEQTIIVVEDSPQNRRAYEDLVIQTFFLSNAEVKDVMTMLRSLVGAKSVAANDQLNAIALRDTADKVKVAESIIRTNDKSRGEVVVDVELLQINTSKLQELGVLIRRCRSAKPVRSGSRIWSASTRAIGWCPSPGSCTTSSRPVPRRSCWPVRRFASAMASRPRST